MSTVVVSVKTVVKNATNRLLRRGRKDRRSFLLSTLPENAVCAEIGVYKGNFSAKLLKYAKPEVLHLIDPWARNDGADYEGAWYGGQASGQATMDEVYSAVEERFAQEIEYGKVRLHRSPSSEAVSTFPDNYFDWVYIDGDHLYEAVLQDLKLYFPKVKSGGLIAGDDYGKDDHWWGDGVTRAVDEFAEERGLTFLSASEHQFILKKSSSC